MARKCFISFKSENEYYKKYIQDHLDVDIIDKSLNEPIQSYDEDYILRKIRKDYLSDSTVTIHLIGNRSSEDLGSHEQRFIKRELQASLYHRQGNTKSGILGVVLPEMNASIYKGRYYCWECSGNHNSVAINDSTVIKEFSYNYYIPHDKCSWSEDNRYCVLTAWEDFKKDPNKSIEMAFQKRSDNITEKTKVYPK